MGRNDGIESILGVSISDITEQLCKTCDHYSFYSCNQNHSAAPLKVSIDCPDYILKPKYLPIQELQIQKDQKTKKNAQKVAEC
ncbi:hypothetical protein NEF87_002086 [Candidatus Lokiarchaeum ossiferum]|uniref:Uncharacterized protein n=1 Tax=Candidatus Lokiarchaeum ossiferum TaxID=2951803 RepID=A0ABY6HQV2_9ARCH|nr:hypothetical protein NEF87_002086 [Candidatus Lokiarchaeum sp. B-35]